MYTLGRKSTDFQSSPRKLMDKTRHLWIPNQSPRYNIVQQIEDRSTGRLPSGFYSGEGKGGNLDKIEREMIKEI